jgi:uncharacterized protein
MIQLEPIFELGFIRSGLGDTEVSGENYAARSGTSSFVPHSPELIFTRIAEAKLEMLAEATADAKARAERMAQQGDRRIKEWRSARMGVFQITPPHSTETSWEGINNKTSIEKSIMSTVSASFVLE